MLLRQIFDPGLAQYAYLIGCPETGRALLVDPQRDIDRYRGVAAANGLRIAAVAETHLHADFIGGAAEFAADPEIELYLSGEGGEEWECRWARGRPGTRFLRHGEEFAVGRVRVRALHTPGHTPEHLCYLLFDGGAADPLALLSGDFLFVGDVGRPDLLETAASRAGTTEPAARALRDSLLERLAFLPDFLQILPGHGAGSACGKALGDVPSSTLGYERRFNASLRLALEDGARFVAEIAAGQPEPPLYFSRMKELNRLGSETGRGLPASPRFSAGEALSFAGRGKILDLRSDPQAFLAGHFPKSIHLHFPTPFFQAAAGSYVAEEPVLLILDGESDLDEAVRRLHRIGIDRLAGWIPFRDLEGTEPFPRLFLAAFGPSALSAGDQILDVRSAEEVREGHFEGALTIPAVRLPSRLGEISRSARLLVHCASGKRALSAASYLRSEAFDAVFIEGNVKNLLKK